MAVDRAAWLASLQALLPPGLAFTREPGSVLTRVLDAFAAFFFAGQQRAEDLRAQSELLLASSMLPDWERFLALPDACTITRTQTLLPGAYAAVTLADIFSFSRPGPATYYNAAGVLTTAVANEPRFDYSAF